MENYQDPSSNIQYPITEKAGFGRRFVAFTIDFTLVIVFMYALTFCGILAVPGAVRVNMTNTGVVNPEIDQNVFYFVYGVALLLATVYFIILWARSGQTLGKKIMGIKIVSVDGSPVSFGKAIIRFIGYWISTTAFLGFIWAAFDANKQGWHDKIAGTYVVRK